MYITDIEDLHHS